MINGLIQVKWFKRKKQGAKKTTALMLPRPSTNLSFSNKEINEFTERINELAALKNNINSTNSKFSTILSTPTKNSNGATNQSPSLRTPLQSKK